MCTDYFLFVVWRFCGFVNSVVCMLLCILHVVGCSDLLDFCYVVIAVGADCLVGSLCSCFSWWCVLWGFADCGLGLFCFVWA